MATSWFSSRGLRGKLFAILLIAWFVDSYISSGYNSARNPPRFSRLSQLNAQSLDYTSLFLSVNELAEVSVPGKVENVVQENEFNVFFGIKTTSGNSVWLQFCWHPSAARIGLGYAPPRGETTPYSFAATLRALLRGHSVTKIHIPTAFDRIVEVELSERLSDEKPKWRFILEVMGARSNAILVSYDDNIIQACAYQVSSATTVRPLQTGGIYQPPPSGGGIFSPIYKDSTESTEFLPIFRNRLRELDVSIERSLVSCFRGMSPNIAGRILDVSGIDGAASVRSLRDGDLNRVYRYFAAWASLFDNNMARRMHDTTAPLPVLAIEPGLIKFQNKEKEVFCPIAFKYSDSHGAANLPNEVDSNSESSGGNADPETSLPVSRSLLSFYSSYERKVAFTLLHASCDKKVTLRIKKATKILNDFIEQEKDARGEKCDDLKALGDLVTSFTHSYKEKSQVLQCYDFTTGEPKEISIPLGMTPSDYAKSVYMKAKKLKRSLKVLENLIKKTTLHVDYLLEIDAALSGLAEYVSYEDISTLLEIEEELDELEQLTVIQLGDSSSTGEIPIVTAKLSGKEKDKKKSKSKLKSGKQTKSTVKPSVSGKKAASTNTAPTSRKKALQGLLILRPSSNSKVAVTARDVSSASEDSDADSDGGSAAQFDGKRKTGKRDRAQEVSLTPFSSSLPTLIVGRSSKQNDRITFEIAKEHHLWFHVQGVPGSHVLLQLEPGDDPSPEGIQYAADVASFYSKARGSTKVPVGYCSPKHIRRITGGSPGMVSILQQAGVVYGSPDKGRLWVEKYGPQTVEPYR